MFEMLIEFIRTTKMTDDRREAMVIIVTTFFYGNARNKQDEIN